MQGSRFAARGVGGFLARPVTRRALLGGAAAGGLATAATLWRPWSNDHPRVARQPKPVEVAARWLTFADDPAHDIYVSWSAGPSGGRPAGAAIRWGTTADDQLDAAVTSRRVTVRRAIPGLRAQPTYYSRAHLTGLQPGTTYRYAVTSDGRTWTEDATFTTAPATTAPFRFTAFGDQASHPTTSAPMSRLVAALRPAFHLVAGDLAYASAAGGTTTPSPEHFDPLAWDRYVAQVTHAAAGVPWVPVAGSHEIEPLGDDTYAGFVTRFPQTPDPASGSPVVRSFVYGNVAFVQVDGNDVSQQEPAHAGYTHGAQTRWLAATLHRLRSQTPGVVFLVVVGNVCAYSSNVTHGSDGGVRSEWVPLFDRYQVDLVISGHVHAYERTHPMRGGRPTRQVPAGGRVQPATDGTTYVCCGGGGNGLYRTWLGPTASGDPAATAGSVPIVWRLNGRTPVSVPDHGAAFSAHRRAVYSCVVVDVTPDAGPGTSNVLRVRAIMPEQTLDAVTAAHRYTEVDSVHLVRDAL